MHRASVVVVALCLLAATAGVPGGSAATPAGTTGAFALAQEFDRTQFQVTVHPNGSARWTFHYERTLANDTEREQFEAFAESFRANETGLYTDFQNQSRSLVDSGEAATGRPMDAQAFNRTAYVDTGLNEVGVVELAFTWTGFARPDGDRLVVGDVFEGGLYIGPGQSLVVRPGSGLVFQTVEPEGTLSGESLATSDSVTWQGERTFADNHPRVVLVPADGATTTTDGTGGDPTDGTTATADPGSPLWPVGVVLAVIGGATLAFFYRRRSTGAVTSAPSGAESAAAVDEDALLDDEERVERLLSEHGGRMRQSAIVEATGWSKSKVSMVLSEMAEADDVRKLRMGRENIISLPGHEPDAARSPLEDDEE